jgi:hypothetical protein
MSVRCKTALGTDVEVTFCDDVGENKGGYYCQIHLLYEDDAIDDFVIHKDDLQGRATKESFAKHYVKSINDY